LIVGLTTEGSFLTSSFSMTAFLPAVLALIAAGPVWIIGTSLSVLLMLIVRSGGQGLYTEPMVILLYTLFVSGIVLARMVTDTAQKESEENADQARKALAQSELQAQELARKAHELEAQNTQQRQLLDLVTTLETPVVSLAEGVLLAPIVGHLDSRRAGDLTRRLLSDVSAQHARMVILDIGGVPTVDTAVAQSLLRAIQAVRLLGCEVTVTGISASVAATMTQLGINMAGVRTARAPQEVLGSTIAISPKPMNN
ncbi:MAG: STAS domain-containing protein, partial [Oscillochloris sp.]|nr:STAS domain-containing protein [Oscillochloris sp.]